MNIYLLAVAFGVTLLGASLLLGGHHGGGGDTDHAGGDGHGHDTTAEAILGWAPVTSLRFWTFLLAFGGGAGAVLRALGSSELVSAIAAVVVGWISGLVAVTVVRALTKRSVSSQVDAAELVGTSGTLLLPIGPGKPGKVRVEVKGNVIEFVAHGADDVAELPTGTSVLVVAEADRGALLVAKSEM